MIEDDIISDILRMVAEGLQQKGIMFPESISKQVKNRARLNWGGSRPYIRLDNSEPRLERNSKIIAAWGADPDANRISTRFGLTPRTVRRIVKTE